MKLRKHLIMAVTSVITFTSIGSVGVFSEAYPDSVYTITEDKSTAENLNSLLDFLTRGGADENTDFDPDMNQDGSINVYDYILMKRQLLTENVQGEFTDSAWKATNDNVKLMGRNVILNDVTWLVQSGSAAEFSVTGKSAEIVLKCNHVSSNKDHRTRYAIYADDALLVDDTMNSKEEKITLFSEDSSVTKNIRIILLSEAMYGAVGVDSINVNSCAETPVKPLPKKNLSIEFIGDSITCAYGVEGASSSDAFKTTTENFTKSYAYLTAQKLNADYSAVCYSGHGIVSGFSSGDKNSDSLIPPVYDINSKVSPFNTDWDFDSQKHDVVVINLGTNDHNYVTADIETRSEEFIDGYVNFLKTIREKNPDAFIICTMGTMGGEETCELVNEAVKLYADDTKDSRVTYYKSALQNVNDGLGSDWHPSEVTQLKSAYVLADKICQVLGIESDQVGLDMAADAVYDVDINTENGANAAFYVGYDKSFWINMVTGGTLDNDIVAYLSEIPLKKDGEYRLEFDYTTTVDRDITVSVEGNNIYFSDTIKSSAEKQHFIGTFKASEDDSSANITFNIGGIDSYNVTLSNISLIKTA